MNYFSLEITASLLCFACSRLSAATFTTINTNDNGAGSLRQAIEDANLNLGSDTLEFNIPGSAPAPHVITLLSDMTSIQDDEIRIDATTQPGWSLGDIVVDGASSFKGLIFDSFGGEVRGIHFRNNLENAIVAEASGFGFAVRECLINNTTSLSSSDFSAAIRANNSCCGIIRNCLIGTDVTGTIDESGDVKIGVYMNATTDMTIDFNTISGYTSGALSCGILLHGNSDQIFIADNYIGTDLTGANAIPNLHGIWISEAVDYDISFNVISNNLEKGIHVKRITF